MIGKFQLYDFSILYYIVSEISPSSLFAILSPHYLQPTCQPFFILITISKRSMCMKICNCKYKLIFIQYFIMYSSKLNVRSSFAFNNFLNRFLPLNTDSSLIPSKVAISGLENLKRTKQHKYNSFLPSCGYLYIKRE